MERGRASGANVFGGSRIPEIPVFSGEDAYLWVSRVEKYFHANAINNDPDKLRVVAAALEGPAFDWYLLWKKDTTAALTWPSFKDAAVQRFQPDSADNPFGVLLNTRQTGTVAEYRELFETLALSEPIRNLSVDEIARAVFFNGLTDELKEGLRSCKADSLSDLLRKAQLVEGRNRAVAKFGPRPKTNPLMKFWGKIAGRKVVILWASGACNSQIAKGVVQELGLPVCETDGCFELADGSVVKGEGVCREVVVKVQEDLEIVHDFVVFDQLGGEDLVLGFDWLQKIGSVAMNFRDLTMKFKVAGKAITLKGDPSLTAPDEMRVSFMRRLNIS